MPNHVPAYLFLKTEFKGGENGLKSSTNLQQNWSVDKNLS